MTIMLIAEFFPSASGIDVRGGVEVAAYHWAKGLAARRHTVVVLASHEPGMPREAVIEGIRVLRCGATRRFSQAGFFFARISFLLEVVRRGRTIQPDLVCGMSFLGYGPTRLLAWLRQVPAVAAYHDVWIGEWVRHVGLFYGLLGEVYEHVILALPWHCILANSARTRDRLIARAKIHPERIHVVHNGVDLDACQKARGQKAAVPTITVASRLVQYKRIDDLLRALPKILDELPNVQCRIIGSGPERAALEARAAERGVADHVQFLGFLPRHETVLREIACAHIFCLPSAVEGFGIVTIEAMAVGTPYVSSDIPATREVTDGGKGGVLVPLGDVDALAEGILRLLRDDRAYRRAQEDGIALVQRYDWQRMVEKVERIFLERVGTRSMDTVRRG